MKKISAREIVRSVGMSDNPNCYLGRCAKIQDLDGEMLYAIYKRIQNEIGMKQANAFLDMIKDIYPLSALNFLNELYALEQCNWDNTAYSLNDDTRHIKYSFFIRMGFERGPREREREYLYDDES